MPAVREILKDEVAFDGASRMLLPRSARFVPYQGDFTLSLEMRCAAPDAKTRQALVSSDADDPDLGHFGMPEIGLNHDSRHPGVPYLMMRPYVLLFAKTDVTDGAWHSVAIERANGKMTLRVDGRDEATCNFPYPLSPVAGWALGATAHEKAAAITRHFAGGIRSVYVRLNSQPQ